MSNLDQRVLEELENSIEFANDIIYKKYLSELTNYEVEDFINVYHESKYDEIDSVIKMLKLTKVCYEKDEDILQKLSTVYSSVENENTNLLLMIDSQNDKPIDFYIGFSSFDGNMGKHTGLMKTGFDGNFTGSKLQNEKVGDVFEEIFSEDNAKFITSVSCSTSLRDKTKTERKSFVQGIEKFIDSMQGKAYTAFFIAEPISNAKYDSIKDGLESLHSTISQFEKSVITYNEGDSKSLMDSIREGVNSSVSKAVGTSISETNGTSDSTSIGLSATKSWSGGFSGGGVNASSGGSVTATTNYTHTNTHSETNTTSETNTNTHGVSRDVSKAITNTVNNGSSLQFEKKNKSVVKILEHIDIMIRRLEQGHSYGTYKFAGYFISSRESNAVFAGNTYKALMIGDEIETESRVVNTFKSPEMNLKICEYLIKGRHPIFKREGVEGLIYDATTLVNGLELPIHMGIPMKSVVGLPVVEHVRFGRSAGISKGNGIKLGCVYHMGKAEEYQKIELSADDLTAHTFITGSTGSGKSNTVYHILNEVCKNGKKFLVIEPAKGEYKDVFGGREDVTVFGTNPYKSKLLKINPFSFPKEIHVLEHIDRLIEIFNACWPMYAAMPAVLKSTIENSYVKCGWNLGRSTSITGRFPTFSDILKELPIVVENKGFSNDTQNDYKGALLTRIESLTNGINGQVFCACDETSYETLFDTNVIVDLSRVGSAETKSLLMGILVLKLSEYRSSQRDLGINKSNSGLEHLTVLEEAHNLLKRTSSEQSQESSNVQGKSVEMISNAIAELRTYGEGFIIADQSPGLMDMAAIRNTNTKIIMRLPDLSDRELVGKAASLNDDQIKELSRLDVGVAATYQSGWLEPVLCKVDYFDDLKSYEFKEEVDELTSLREVLIFDIMNGTDKLSELTKEQVDSLKKWATSNPCSAFVKETLLNALNSKIFDADTKKFAYQFVEGKSLVKDAVGFIPRENLIDFAVSSITDKFSLSQKLAKKICEQAFKYVIDNSDKSTETTKILQEFGGVM